MKITVVKLTTGDEVIGKLVESEKTALQADGYGEFIVLETARTLVMQQGEGGQIGLGMMPFMPSADNPSTDSESNIRIYTKFIVAAPTDVPKDLEDAYVRSTSKIAIV